MWQTLARWSARHGAAIGGLRALCTHTSGGASVARLSSRTLLRVSGADSEHFLQGLVSQDVRMLRAAGDTASEEGTVSDSLVAAALLNPQGRVVCDLLLGKVRGGDANGNDSFVLECAEDMRAQLLRMLKVYKLRSHVTIEDQSAAWGVWSVFGDAHAAAAPEDARGADGRGLWAAADPRHAALGHRVWAPLEHTPEWAVPPHVVDESEYTAHRCTAGVGEGTADLPPGKALPLESNLDLLGAVSYGKGCYVGQELTARTHHRGVTRKRLVPVRVDGDAVPPVDTDIVRADTGRRVGKMRSGAHGVGLALLRVEHVLSGVEMCAREDKARVVPAPPVWWREHVHRESAEK